MQGVIVHPADLDGALRAPEVQAEVSEEAVGEVVLPTPTLTSRERLAIYKDMYLLRMEEALASDFPGLKHFLGDRGFWELVAGYVQAFPSRSFSLNPLGNHLPEYVKQADGIPRRDFCHDLARVELAIAQAFDGEETPSLAEAEIAAVPEGAWERARLLPVATCRLLAVRYPVSAYLDSLDDEDHRHPPARRKDGWMVVYRRDYTVRRLDLPRAAHDLLADLIAGAPLREAVGRAARTPRRALGEDDLFKWFRQWVAGGVFRAVELA
jgi:hypothetical protein